MTAALTHDTAVALARTLAAKHRAALHLPTDPLPRIARAALDALDDALPVIAPLTGAVLDRLGHVSVTLPTPLGTVILLSEAACETPEALLATAAHECQHAAQIEARGGFGTAVDYLGSGELRARAEADAYMVGVWVVYLLTGQRPDIRGAMLSLAGPVYHLAPADVSLGRGVMESHLAAIEAGLCPPLSVARDVLALLRAEAPELVVVALRALPGEVGP